MPLITISPTLCGLGYCADRTVDTELPLSSDNDRVIAGRMVQ